MFVRELYQKGVYRLKAVRKCVKLAVCFALTASMLLIQGTTGTADTNGNNAGGRTFRIAYCESEAFINYSKTSYWLLKAMEEVGLVGDLSGMQYRDGDVETAEMWKWLSEHKASGWKVEFVENAWFSIGTEMLAGADREKIIEKIGKRMKEGDLDLIIAMGTDAGKVLSSLSLPVDVMVFSASNPIKSGIVKAAESSGVSGIWAHVDLNRFKRQLRVINDTFKPQQVGVVYENSDNARIYSAIEDIESVASQYGFSIERIFVDEPKSEGDKERYYNELKSAYRQLSEKVDAFYLTVASIEKERLQWLLEPFMEKGIPVFSQLGADEVEYGALMSITAVDFKNVARFGTDVIGKAIAGAKLEELPQQYESTPMIIVNLSTAEKIGFQVPFEMLLIADAVYTKSEVVSK